MSTHLPLRIARPLHRKCTTARCSGIRPFSLSAPRQKKSKQQPGESAKDPDQKAPSTIESEAQANQNDLVEDVGLLPGTFVRAHEYASRLSHEKGRWSYEWKWAKTKIRDWYSMKYYLWYMKDSKWKWWDKKPWNGKRELRRDARQYYETIYEAFASKSETQLKKFCLPGIISHFNERWAARPHDLVMSWKLHEIYRGSPRIVSNRMGHLPIPDATSRAEPSAIRQVVLRISSRQELIVEREVVARKKESKVERLARMAWRPEGAKEQSESEDELEKPVTRHTKDVVEYIVLQRRMLKGEEEPWKVWGFVEPTTLAKLGEAVKTEEQAKAYNAARMGLA